MLINSIKICFKKEKGLKGDVRGVCSEHVRGHLLSSWLNYIHLAPLKVVTVSEKSCR